MEADAGEVELLGRARRDRRAIVVVVGGLEERLGIDREPKIARRGALCVRVSSAESAP